LSCVVSAFDHTSTSAAKTRHKTSIERVLRTGSAGPQRGGQ
jgi:hypothetical protein